MSMNMRQNCTLRLTELGNENIYYYTGNDFITGQILKDVNNNSNYMFLHPHLSFHDNIVVKKHKVDIMGQRLPDLFDIKEEKFEKYSKMA